MAWFRRRSRRRDADHLAEMRAHVDLLADQLEAQGRSPAEARREARLQFGNPDAKIDVLGPWRDLSSWRGAPPTEAPPTGP